MRANALAITLAAIASAFPGEADLPVLVAPIGFGPLAGDYQCNSAMSIAKMLKGTFSPLHAGMQTTS